MQTHTAGHSCRPAGNGSLAGKGDGGLCRHLRALQTSPLISKDDAINYPDEHLPSASEQASPGRDEQVQEVPSPQGLLALTKTFPFSTG